MFSVVALRFLSVEHVLVTYKIDFSWSYQWFDNFLQAETELNNTQWRRLSPSHLQFAIDLLMQWTPNPCRLRKNGTLRETWLKAATKYHLDVASKIDSYHVNVNHVEISHEILTWPYFVSFKYFELFSSTKYLLNAKIFLLLIALNLSASRAIRFPLLQRLAFFWRVQRLTDNLSRV